MLLIVQSKAPKEKERVVIDGGSRAMDWRKSAQALTTISYSSSLFFYIVSPSPPPPHHISTVFHTLVQMQKLDGLWNVVQSVK